MTTYILLAITGFTLLTYGSVKAFQARTRPLYDEVTKQKIGIIRGESFKESIAGLYEKITLRTFYQDKFKKEFRNLYNSRISNLLDYLDEKKATIIVSDRVTGHEFNVNNARVLICGEHILFDNNLVTSTTGMNTAVSVVDSSNLRLSNSTFDSKK